MSPLVRTLRDKNMSFLTFKKTVRVTQKLLITNVVGFEILNKFYYEQLSIFPHVRTLRGKNVGHGFFDLTLSI